MDFKSAIAEGLKNSLKSRDAIRASVHRMLLASIKNKEVEKRGPLSEDEFYSLVRKSINQHNESIESFKKGNRPDLVEKEQAELDILNIFLPASLTDEEISKEIGNAIGAVEATTQKDMGKVIKAVLEKFPGRIDGKKLSAMVLKRLSSG
jgi:uncharacterized protein YqeY